jgi:hypothetical protein
MYKVTARQYGNSVEFEIEADSNKQALLVAKAEARNLFDYQGIGDEPTVSVKPIKEREE